MKAEEIPAFVHDVIEAGCNIWAVGDDRYVVGDSDLSEAEYRAACPDLARIQRVYGNRDHLRGEIVAYLRTLGRYIELGNPPVEH
ncbi:hypothetical protein LB577_14730 [Mesorhizobium sp. B283B1A]|nr:hypothetical protein [Mesorhizobium opportunistum]MCA0048199.1 hypothetical protein [Mesorhizobium sp. B283B1A]UQS67445.1 hypothetical protein M5D98_14440 [Mesorhizobium opportunistum]